MTWFQDLPSWTRPTITVYDWAAMILTFWFCATQTRKGNLIGTLLVTFIFGWIIAPLVLYWLARGRRTLWVPRWLVRWANSDTTAYGEPRVCTHPPGCTHCNWCGYRSNHGTETR